MAAALQEGDLFAGRYRIMRELASGGMGAVYEVVHTVTERRCALKVMLAHTVEREILRKRFMQESRLAAQIGSEYIVDVLDAGVDDETKAPYLVMELLEGEDLGQRLQRLGPLSREEAVLYLWHVALALDRTHQAGIVHRDLKASNLFLTRREDGSPLVKVLDFGVAKVLTIERSGEQRTQTVGTPIYMAPEQFRADGRISPATDIYALGMLSYTLLVGMHYWREEHEKCENPFAFASIAVNGPKESPVARARHEGVPLPETFDAWFMKATSRWPQDRFPSATAAIGELAVALGVEPPAPSLPALSVPPASGISYDRPPTPSIPLVMDGGSGRVPTSGTGNKSSRAKTPSASSGAKDRTGGSDSFTGEHHTEVSLSVTSGGLPLQVEEAPAPRSRAKAVGVLALFAISVIGIGIARTWRSTPTAHELGAKAPTTQPSAAAQASANPSSLVNDEPVAPTRIEDLPLAAPEPKRTVVPDTPRKPVRKPSHVTHPSTAVTQTAPTSTSTAAPDKSVDREKYYTRD